jgi:hypothetical protein
MDWLITGETYGRSQWTTKEQMHPKEEVAHPKGALLLIVVYLLGVILLWTHTYLRLWIKG